MSDEKQITESEETSLPSNNVLDPPLDTSTEIARFGKIPFTSLSTLGSMPAFSTANVTARYIEPVST